MNKTYDVIVIGAGQAGLATGYHLKRSGHSYLILEASGEAAGSWPHYYDSLKLFSPAKYSSLPGMSFPTKGDHYPVRDEVVQYLRSYASFYQFPIAYHQYVETVDKISEIFQVMTTTGELFRAKNIICATGSFNRPNLPSIEGHEDFKGSIIHSSNYSSPASFADQSIIVVGSGNSAVQIAIELSEIANTTLAVRELVSLMPQRIIGRDIHYWFKMSGIDSLSWFRKLANNSSLVIDVGGYKKSLRTGKPIQKQMFSQFYSDGVVWSDGSRESVDRVLFATGFKSNLNFIRGIGALDEQGNPIHKRGISATVPGLYYVGLSGQRSFASATLRGVGRDAGYVVKNLLM
jgi:putative flavoprotein involved in K+ transport